MDVSTRYIPNPCTVVRPNPHPGRGTVLVLGPPRSGTSVTAGICHVLGVRMGMDIDHSNVEDREFHAVLTKPDVARAAAEYFAQLARLAPCVGVKNPVTIDQLRNYYHVIPNPVLVVISRDVYAAAQREQCSGNDFFGSLRAAIRRKYSILNFVEVVDEPLIVLSYERLMQDPTAAAETLGRFIFGDLDPILARRAAVLVRPHADMPGDVDFVAERDALEAGRLGGARSVA